MNLLQNTEHKADVAGIINVALSELEFQFKAGTPEELRIMINDLRERCQRVQAEFNANFDQKEEKYVLLADEFREYFRKKGFVPQDTNDAKESIQYMDAVMAKIREINRRNNMLKKKYKGDERFVRVHKRLMEHNEQNDRPLISKQEYEVALNLVAIKGEIDGMLFKDIHHLDNEDFFKQDVLYLTGQALRQSKIRAQLDDRKYISNLIVNEYINQYQRQAY